MTTTIDIERARRDAENGSMVAKVALAVWAGQADNWPEPFRRVASEEYALDTRGAHDEH